MSNDTGTSLRGHSPEYLGRHPVQPWPEGKPPRGRWARARYAQTTGCCPFCNAPLPVWEQNVYSGALMMSYRRSQYNDVCPVCGRSNSPLGTRWMLPAIIILALFMLVALVVGVAVSAKAGGIVFGTGLGGLVLAAIGYTFVVGYPGLAFGFFLMLVGTVWAVVSGQFAPFVVLGGIGLLFTGLSRSGPRA